MALLTFSTFTPHTIERATLHTPAAHNSTRGGRANRLLQHPCTPPANVASHSPPGGASGSGQPRRVRPRRGAEGGEEEEDEGAYPLTPATREVGRPSPHTLLPFFSFCARLHSPPASCWRFTLPPGCL